MKLIFRNIMPYLKMFTGIIALFLFLFGIHWIAISVGVCLGIVYFFMPKIS